MSNVLQAIRGMHDILPEQITYWQYVEETVKNLLGAYGYQEIRTPVLEKTELFKRSIGEVTDIVEKEMYTFEDRNGDSLSLRPEGTASCVRACNEHGLLYNQTQKLWYAGPMFRHERPQKGRYRQFYQIGVEAFGLSGPDIDAEMILASRRLWQSLGLDQAVTLELNTLGTSQARANYREALVAYLQPLEAELDEDSQRRLHTNPLRILDSKAPKTRAIVAKAPQLADFLDEESKTHFAELKSLLDAAGVEYKVNPHLVRGLDYYGRTVFEWVTDKLGAQGTVCAGGRFDALVEHLGGKPTPAIGMAMGVERIIAMLEELNVAIPQNNPHVYFVLVGEPAQKAGLALSEKMRDALPGLRMVVNNGGGSFKAQMKRADKSGADWALLLGEDELQQNAVSIKPLRSEGAQQRLAHDALMEFLTNQID